MANQDPHLSYRELAEQLLLPYSKKINPTIKQYRDILNKGLPGKASQKKKIIVVGAGIAGMLAAKLLSDYGHEVSIIEANDNRVGGRIKTFGEPGRKSPFRDKEQYAEAGAMRFPLDLHPLLKAYIAKYKLETQEFYIADVDPNHPRRKRFNAWLRCNSFQQRRREYNKNPAATNERFTEGASVPSPTETAGDLLDAALDKARDYFSYVNDKGKRVNKPYEEWIEGWAKIIEDFDEYTLLRYLREEAGLDQRTIDLIGTIENLTSRLPLSFIHSFLGRSDINTSNVYSELVGGSWHLTEAIYQDIKADVDVKLNRRMTLIDFCREDGVCGRHAGPTKPLSIWTVDENEQPAGRGGGKGWSELGLPGPSLRIASHIVHDDFGVRRRAHRDCRPNRNVQLRLDGTCLCVLKPFSKSLGELVIESVAEVLPTHPIAEVHWRALASASASVSASCAELCGPVSSDCSPQLPSDHFAAFRGRTPRPVACRSSACAFLRAPR